jgi:hypothetical protein
MSDSFTVCATYIVGHARRSSLAICVVGLLLVRHSRYSGNLSSFGLSMWIHQMSDMSTAGSLTQLSAGEADTLLLVESFPGIIGSS